MYTKINNPSIVIYNGETNEFIGTATFTLTSKSEEALLQLLNYGIKPSSITVLNLNLYQPSATYIPPTPYNAYRREGTIYASVTDAYTGTAMPVEISIKYDARARGNSLGTLYHFDSAEFSNIEIESVKIIY